METNCPCCPNHCPADALRCGRGRAHFAQNGAEPREEHAHHEGIAHHGHPMQEMDPALALLRQCGHFLHHMGPGSDPARLMSVLTAEEAPPCSPCCRSAWTAGRPTRPVTPEFLPSRTDPPRLSVLFCAARSPARADKTSPLLTGGEGRCYNHCAG